MNVKTDESLRLLPENLDILIGHLQEVSRWASSRKWNVE